MECNDSESASDPTQRLFELTTLYELSRMLLGSTSQEHLSFNALTAVMGLTGAEWGILWVTDTAEGRTVPINSCGMDITLPDSGEVTPGWWADLTSFPEPRRRGDDGNWSVSGREPVNGPPPWALLPVTPDMVLPLVERGRLQGLMTLGPNPLRRPHSPFLMGLLGSIGHLVAIALGRFEGAVGVVRRRPLPSIQEYRRQYPMLGEIVGESQPVLDLYTHLTTVASSSCTVLFSGETGSGKELAARVLHRLSHRADGPFVEVDCGAIPENLIESELFGHARGSFTGATQSRRGVFELADGGTLFLDEVANLPLQVQNRLLRVLQEQRFRPVGGETNVEVDVRVVAATNQDLRRAVEEGTFREDLFYRLYVYPVHIPPLRERCEDIPLLAAYYLDRCARENGVEAPRLSEAFLERLRAHDYPGNIRELRHLIEWALLRSAGRDYLAPETIDRALEAHLPAEPVTTPSSPGPEAAERSGFPRRAGIERGLWVLDLLRRHRFNVKATAEDLTARAHADPDNPPPLTDRSSLTYYFQVECFRHLLEHDGDIEAAAHTITDGATPLIPTVKRRISGYLNSAAIVLEPCRDLKEAQQVLREKFLKLPEDYMTVLDQLADHLMTTRVADTRPT